MQRIRHVLALGTPTFVCAVFASSFFPSTDTFPGATAAGFDVLAGSALGASALTAVEAAVLYSKTQ